MRMTGLSRSKGEAGRRPADGRPRMIIHDYAGHPFQVQLSRELARRGYLVLHLYAASNPTPKGALVRRNDDANCLTIEGLSVSSPYQRYDFIKRWKHETAYGRKLAKHAASWQPDIVVSCNTPLDPQRMLLRRCRQLDIPFVFWLQDLVGVATEKILRRRYALLGSMIGHYYVAMERRIAQRSSAVVAITEDFLPLLRDWGVSEARQTVIENWAPLSEIIVSPKNNDWARTHGLADKTCFLYTGMLGLKHNPELLFQLAERYRNRPDIAVVVVSEGLGARWLLHRKMEARLNNLIVLGFQPYEHLAEVLASGDILVAILEADAGIFSVPSKVLSYFCAGRPLLAAIPAENLSARIITNNKAGLVVDPGSAGDFLKAAETLLADPTLRDRLAGNARAYAERTFGIERIANRFEDVIRRALS